MSEAIKYTFIWHTVMDERVCPICATLDGLTWEDQNPFDATLRAEGREVWDLLRDHPLTHPNCRCYLEMHVKVNLDDVQHYTTTSKMIKRVDC